MKRFATVLVFIIAFQLLAYGTPEKIILRGGETRPNRDGLPMYYDIPDAYFDDNPKAPLIIIDGDGAVSYYDVEISSPVTNYVEISTQVDGTYDTIDITSLAPGTHVTAIDDFRQQ